MKKYLLTFAILAFASSAVFAEGDGKGPGQMDPAKRQEMFAKMKQARVEGMQARITIMQTALNCVNAANDHDQMKACHEKEHEAMKSLEQQQREKMQAMRPEGGKGEHMRHEGGDRK